MRHLKLRTQLGIVTAFLALYTCAVAVSYRVQLRAQAELERSFESDLRVLIRLPRLTDQLRHLGLLTSQYLLTGDARWLEERRSALRGVRRTMEDLSSLLVQPSERTLWESVYRQLSVYLSDQEQWIERKGAGRLSLVNAVGVVGARDEFDGLILEIAAMRDSSVLELRRRREAARYASQWTFYMTLATGFIFAVLLAAAVSLYVIGPLTTLEVYASSWKLGEPWELAEPSAGPEVPGLFERLREMARRLNADFVRERELAQFKSQLVSLVSHEFNNALSVISGAATLLEESESGEKPERRAHYFAMLKSNIRALHIAAENLLNMGRQEDGRFSLSVERVDLRALTQQAVNRLDILALRKGLSTAIEAADGPCEVKADPDALSLALTNLVGNAIKYTPQQGRITVRLEPEPGKVKISVQDSGIGISPEDREKIFTGFYRTKEGKSAAKGFGVGLPLAKRIVEAHGAVLRVDSELGKGSTFSFSLEAA